MMHILSRTYTVLSHSLLKRLSEYVNYTEGNCTSWTDWVYYLFIDLPYPLWLKSHWFSPINSSNKYYRTRNMRLYEVIIFLMLLEAHLDFTYCMVMEQVIWVNLLLVFAKCAKNSMLQFWNSPPACDLNYQLRHHFREKALFFSVF